MATSLITQALTSNTTPAPYVASASSEAVGYGAWRVFNKTSGYWSTNATPTGWVAIDLGSAYTAATYTVQAASALYDRAPNTWTLQGSNDGTNWTTLDSQSGQTWANTTARQFTVATPGSYRRYRLNVTANNGNASYLAFDELDLLGADAPTATLAGTLPALTGSFAATSTPPTVTGTLGGSLPALTGSFTGNLPDVPTTATLGGTLPALVGSLAGGSPAPAVETSTTYANLGGYNYHGESEVDYDPPVAPSPARIKPTPIQRVHQSLPVPTLVNGRPV